MGADPSVRFDASMYFRFGRSARPEVRSKTCFDAVVSGERTSTTRFEDDSRTQYAQWRGLRPGDLVRIWSGPWREGGFSGKSCIVQVTEAPRIIDIHDVNREAWSRTEGWNPDFLDVLLGEGKRIGVQVYYRLHTPPDDPQMGLGLSA